MSANVLLRSADGVMACELGEGLALLHQASGTFYILGEIEAFIWNRLSTAATQDEVVGAVRETYDGAPDDIERDVGQFLREMLDGELLEADAVVATA